MAFVIIRVIRDPKSLAPFAIRGNEDIIYAIARVNDKHSSGARFSPPRLSVRRLESNRVSDIAPDAADTSRLRPVFRTPADEDHRQAPLFG